MVASTSGPTGPSALGCTTRDHCDTDALVDSAVLTLTVLVS
jgi:hypothetical protein